MTKKYLIYLQSELIIIIIIMANQELKEFYIKQTDLYTKLIKRLENTEGYQKKDIDLIEKECTKAVKNWIKKNTDISIIKQEEHFIKRLYDPFTNIPITELDGAIVIKKKNTEGKVLIIVESKHHATLEEINDKTKQIPNIQEWINEEKKYYEISKDYQRCVDQQRQIKNELKALRRRIRRGNAGNNVNNTLENKSQILCRLVESEPKLEDELDQEIEKNNWHKNFVKTLQSQNLRFDKFVMFFGAPIWEKDEYKLDLLKQNIGIIEVSGNRYQVKPEKITI